MESTYRCELKKKNIVSEFLNATDKDMEVTSARLLKRVVLQLYTVLLQKFVRLTDISWYRRRTICLSYRRWHAIQSRTIASVRRERGESLTRQSKQASKQASRYAWTLK